MKTQYLNDGFYMNPFTGCVDTALGWEKDYFWREEESQSWEEWGGESLIEVERLNGEWVEV